MGEMPPGPPLPAVAQTALWLAAPLRYFAACTRRYGDAFTLKLVGIGDLAFVSDPAHVKQVLTADPDVLRAGEGNRALRPLLGASSLFMLDGAEHQRHRKMLLPGFGAERVLGHTADICRIADDELDRWPLGQDFMLRPGLERISTRVILRAVLGDDDDPALHRAADALAEVMALSPLRLGLAMAGVDPLRALPWTRLARRKRELDESLRAHIRGRRAAGGDRGDLLAVMLAARDAAGRAFTDDEIANEVVTMLNAGKETTATQMTWIFETILADRRVLEAVRAELRAQVGDGPIDAAAVPRLTYLEAAIRETMRLFPVVVLVLRHAARAIDLGRFQVRAGATVAPFVLGTHHLARVYPEPDQFRPERFLDGRPDPYAWLPFGGGARRCIGMTLAMLEMKCVVATVLARATLRLAAGGRERPTRMSILLSPEHCGRAVLELRRPRATCRAAG